jgi:hypothetical protein
MTTPTNQYSFNCWFCHKPLTAQRNAIDRYDWNCLPCAKNNNLEKVHYIVQRQTLMGIPQQNEYYLLYVNFNVILKNKEWLINVSENNTSIATIIGSHINWLFYRIPAIITPQNARNRLATILTFS